MAEDIDAALKRAAVLLQENDSSAAETLCRKICLEYPSDFRVYYPLGMALLSQSRLPEAIEALRAFTQRFSEHGNARNNLACALFLSGDLDGAREQFNAAADLVPDNPSVWINFSELQIRTGERDEAIASLEKAVQLAPDNTELKDKLTALQNADEASPVVTDDDRARDLRQTKIYELVPLGRDFDALPMVSNPYLVQTAAPNYESPTLSTDEFGFRSLVKSGRRIGYHDYLEHDGRKGILCGSSPIFGYGLEEEGVLHNRLTAIAEEETLWYSLAIPLSNILQQRFALELFAPRDLDYCVSFVGGMAVFMALLSPILPEPYPPLFGVRTPGKTRKKNDCLYDGTEVADIAESFEIGTRTVCDNMKAISAWLRERSDCRVLYCCLPNLAHLDKPLTPEEATLRELFYEKHKGMIAIRQDPTLSERWQAFDRTIAATARECGADFIDLAKDEIYGSDEWLYLDQFHPSQRNIDHIADRILNWTSTG